MEKIRVIVADDHPIFRDGLVRTLQDYKKIEVIDAVADATTAIASVIENMPDVVLLDVSMPGDGLIAAEEIAACCPVVKIILLTSSEDIETVHSGLSKGALGYVLKGVSAGQLVEIVEQVASGEAYITPSLAASLLKPRDISTDSKNSLLGELTVREQEILKELSQGLSNKEISEKLHVAERTVKHHMTNILSKLHLKNRVEAALFAHKNL